MEEAVKSEQEAVAETGSLVGEIQNIEPVSSSSKKGSFLSDRKIVIPGLIALLFVVLGGVFLISKTNKTAPPPSATTPPPTVEPEPSLPEEPQLLLWNTFRENELSFKYPKNWTEVESAYPEQIIRFETPEKGVFSVDVIGATGFECYKVLSRTERLVDGINFTVNEMQGYQDENCSTTDQRILAWGPKDDQYDYVITYELAEGDVIETERTIFDKILNSFRFSVGSPVNTADWKTYSNPDLGVKLLYPSDLYTPMVITVSEASPLIFRLSSNYPSGVDETGPLTVANYPHSKFEERVETLRGLGYTPQDTVLNSIPVQLFEPPSVTQVPEKIYFVVGNMDFLEVTITTTYKDPSLSTSYLEFNNQFVREEQPILEAILSSIRLF